MLYRHFADVRSFMPKLLIVDDERNVLYSLERALRQNDLEIVTAQTGREGLAAIPTKRPDVVLLDVQLPDQSGLEVLQQLQKIDARLPVIIMTAHGTADTAIEAMKHGAFDYILKPWKLDELKDLVERALQASKLSRVPAIFDESSIVSEGQVDRIIGNSSRMQTIFKEIGRIAHQDMSVLILGESGTGKELVARAIYHHSHRKDQPFLAINCAALPDALLESELFGHEKGAFTGADRRRIGKFEQAHRGTIFLDEIGDMALATQAKVLRVLQDGQFERIGGNETIRCDVRIIAATNKDLTQAIAQKQFRQDLFYRLNTFVLHLSPLRDRPEDIPALVQHFLRQNQNQVRRNLTGIAPDALDALQQYSWPGNVRELENVIKYAIVHAHGDMITIDAFPPQVRSGASTELALRPGRNRPTELSDIEQLIDKLLVEGRTDLQEAVHDVVDRLLFTRALAYAGGQQAKAAAILGISRNTLRTRLQQLGLSLEKMVRDELGDVSPND
jgi:two-component system nitrogen regulation response regulator GlnG